MGWYLTITEEMRGAGLTGNALLIFALINGYSQQAQGCYYGSLSHTAEVVGCTAETARTTLKSLTEAGLLERFEFMDNGIHRVAYRTTQKIWDTQKIWEDPPKNLGAAPQKIWDNIDTNRKIDTKPGIYSGSARFVPPTMEEVAEYCRERRNGIDPQAFIDHYTSNGWKVGKSPMKDWRAAVRTWEAHRKENAARPRPAPRPRYESPEEHNLRVLAAMQGRDGNLHTFNQTPDEQ